MKFVLVVILLLAVVTASAADPDALSNLAIWCEFMPYEAVLETLPTLARHRCDLILHVGPADVGDEALARVIREAHALGVGVSAWFLLPYDEHLYVGEETISATRKLALSFVDWSRRERLGVKWVAFDCEPSPLLGRKLFAAVRRGRIGQLAGILRGEQDADRFAASIAALNALIDELHASDVLVMGAANRVFLDFLQHGNVSVQDALNAPFSMIRWDRASFITYRYKASHGQYVAMVNRYGALARQRFGERAALDIGLIGDQRGFPEHRERAELFGGGDQFIGYLNGMRSVYELEEIAGIARGRDIRHINLYSLEGAVNSVAGLDRWLEAASAAQPLTGLARWTPVQSAKLRLVSGVLNGLFTALVGEFSNDWKNEPEIFQ